MSDDKRDRREWKVDPIIVRPGGQIEALSIHLIPRAAPFGLPPKGDG